MKLEIFDTTLRDGEQGAGVEFSADDRLRVIHALDALGVSYIEAGMITSDADKRFFASLGEVQSSLDSSKLTVFCRTVKNGVDPADDEYLTASALAPVPAASIYGKASLYQVTDVLGITPDENLGIIRESVKYLRENGKEVVFDAEHFFDGYSDNPAYAVEVLEAAYDAGASSLVLCDTNGGMLPDVVGLITHAVCEKFADRCVKIGIHCHNDMGMAVSCSVSAVLEGAVQVQGTISGIGERCGNANLSTLIPVLQLKLGFECIGDNIKSLTKTAREVADSANLSFNESEPFVGGYAFTHKAGAHIDGVKKHPKAFEHISPEMVGNYRNLVMSGLSGRAALLDKLRAYLPDENFTKSDKRVIDLLAIIKEKESRGYAYEDAGASLALVVTDYLGMSREFFSLKSLKVIVDESVDGAAEELVSSAVIKISVGGSEELTAGEGNGPVNAIDTALRRALSKFYPIINKVRLTDYRVRVLDSAATASVVRVAIESTDGESVWRTVGVSGDVINASWQALCDSVVYILSQKYPQTKST